MSVQIRPYQKTDHDAICEMGRQIVSAGDVFPFENVQGVVDYWFSKNSSVFVAEIENQVVGSYVIKPNHPDRCAHVANAGYMVDEQYRAQGVGRAMAEHSLEIASQLGYLAMQFNLVVSTNESAVHLWQRLGFQIIGTVPKAFRHETAGYVDLLIMHRDL